MEREVVKLQKLIGKMCITIGEIPTSFKMSLTYEEQLLWFCNYLENTVIPAINNNAEITQELLDYVKDINVNFEDIYNQLKQLKEYVDDTIEKQNLYIENKLNEFYNYNLSLINQAIDTLNAELTVQVNLLNNRIDQIELGQINAYNPTTGRYENINKVLTDIYDSVRYDAITVSEFEALEFTATAFDAIEITAYNFDNNGKSILTNA